MSPKPIVIKPKPQEEDVIKASDVALARDLVSGVLADMKSANPRIYEINPIAYDRWKNKLDEALQLLRSLQLS